MSPLGEPIPDPDCCNRAQREIDYWETVAMIALKFFYEVDPVKTAKLCDMREIERLQRIEKAADRVANWDQRRIVPTEECPNLATAIHLLREELAAVGGDPE